LLVKILNKIISYLSPLILSLLLFRAAIAEQSILLFYEQRPPYVAASKDGTVKGLTATPSANAFRSAKLPFKWKVMPFKRQLAVFKENKIKACGIGWFKKPEREAFTNFTKPVYQDEPTVIVSKQEMFADNQFSSLAQIFADSRFKLLVKDSFSYGVYFDDLIHRYKPAMEITTTATQEQMITMILTDRADYFLSGKEETEYMLKTLNIAAERLKLTSFLDFPKGNKRYIACTKKVSPLIIERLNQSL